MDFKNLCCFNKQHQKEINHLKWCLKIAEEALKWADESNKLHFDLIMDHAKLSRDYEELKKEKNK